MGGLNPAAFLGSLGSLTPLLGLAGDIYATEQQARQQRRELDQAQAAADADAAGRIEAIRAAEADANAERQAALRRAMARQRARLGASGIDLASGSGEAILLGLVDETELERDRARGRATRDIDAIRRRLSATRRSNLLARRRLRSGRLLGHFGNLQGFLASLPAPLPDSFDTADDE